MNELLITILTWIGAFTLYVVAGAWTGSVIYKQLKNNSEDARIIFAVFGGVLWFIALPLGIGVGMLIKYFESLIYTCRIEEDEKPKTKKEDGNGKVEHTRFKTGDLVTCIDENPEGYSHLYPGCVCRVIRIEEDDDEMDVVLIDHIDIKAQRKFLGIKHTVPIENFKLIPKKKPSKKVSKRKR